MDSEFYIQKSFIKLLELIEDLTTINWVGGRNPTDINPFEEEYLNRDDVCKLRIDSYGEGPVAMRYIDFDIDELSRNSDSAWRRANTVNGQESLVINTVSDYLKELVKEYPDIFPIRYRSEILIEMKVHEKFGKDIKDLYNYTLNKKSLKNVGLPIIN